MPLPFSKESVTWFFYWEGWGNCAFLETKDWIDQVKVLLTQIYPILCKTMDYSQPGSSVLGILQARILEWVAVPISSRSFWLGDRTQVSCMAGKFFTVWASREVWWHFLICSVYQSRALKFTSPNLVFLLYQEWATQRTLFFLGK